MVTVTHNKARLRDGKPMRAAGQRASFLKYLGDACKGRITEGLSPLVETRTGWLSAFAGAPTPIHVTRIGTDLYRISWKRPAGRGGIAEGKRDVERSVTVRCAEDVHAYLADIENQHHPLEIEPVG